MLNGASEAIGSLSGGNNTPSNDVGQINLGTGGTLTVNSTSSTTFSGDIIGTNATFIKRGGSTLTAPRAVTP